MRDQLNFGKSNKGFTTWGFCVEKRLNLSSLAVDKLEDYKHLGQVESAIDLRTEQAAADIQLTVR